MASLGRQTLVVLYVAGLVATQGAGASKVGVALLQLTARARGTQYLRSTPDQAVLQTLRTLDSNSDGKVAPEEVKAFALAQGLDAEEVASEFSGLDSNGDGTLDSAEISAALGGAADTPKVARPHGVGAAANSAPRVEGKQTSSASASSKTSSISSSSSSSRRREAAPAAAIEGAHKALAAAPASRTRSAAELAADSLVEDLSQEESSEREAQTLELQAAELRANSTALAQQAAQRATAAGKKAALDKAQAILNDLSKLETDAAKAEEQAAELRAASRAYSQQAQDLMAVADEALQHQQADASARAEDG